MSSELPSQEISRRRTFAIISHPDAGKTTVTEKLLLYGGAIALAGTVKGRKAKRHATSDWMAMEQQRGISVTTSVMQFPYRQHVFNLLDTPGHEDFSEDTYRTLSAVDSALMVIDIAKGVEQRTQSLMEVCRLRDTPILTFINKMDRDGRVPLDVIDEIEQKLGILCAPMTWPLGMGKHFKGIYHLLEDAVYLFHGQSGERVGDLEIVKNWGSKDFEERLGLPLVEFREEVELIREAAHAFDQKQFLAGNLTPVYFGSALNNIGMQMILDAMVDFAPGPQPRQTVQRVVEADDPHFTGFVFKIQANMDPKHRDRVAFMRICSGMFTRGMRLTQVRTGREQAMNQALTFMAGDREHVEQAWPGDIIGLHNHGTIQIGDTFTQGEQLQFKGIPYFAPELFRRVRVVDPTRSKHLQRGLLQLSEEGATQVFRPLMSNDLILGAVGALQFDVVADRLQHEYHVDCRFEATQVKLMRWIVSDDARKLDDFKHALRDRLAWDAGGALAYLAPSRVNLELTEERWPDIHFLSSREHHSEL